MTFKDLNLPKTLQKAIDDLGFETPTPIQVKALPVIASGRDVIGISQTGTGKTFAYLLPILKNWTFQNTNAPRVLILVPTRELVVQVVEEVDKLTKYMSIKAVGIYGGTNINPQRAAVSEGVDVLVGTPGRTLDLALDGILRFDNLQKLVIDEFDEMLTLGFKTQVTTLLTMMKRKRQNILFSATMTEDVDDVIDDYFEFPEEVSLAPSGTPLESIEQIAFYLPNFLTKLNLLNHLLKDEALKRVLVFTNNKKLVEFIHESVSENFPNEFDILHANKSQNYRLNALRSFQNHEIRGIITTDVMSRGLDIIDISHVINLDLPIHNQQYMHRIGRTGRADKLGVAISMITPKEEEQFIEIQLMMAKDLPYTDLPKVLIEEKLLEFEKDKPKVLIKTNTINEGGKAFHEKKDKNKKINLGGPGKRKPPKQTGNRAQKKKKNG
jgi:ATP-dependent RNA helicase RhlE